MARSTFKVLFYVNGSKGEERYCPHHGTGDNQRTVAQFSCKQNIPKTLWDVKGTGRKGKSQGHGTSTSPLDNIKAQIIKHYQKLSDREDVRDGGNGAQRLSGNRQRV